MHPFLLRIFQRNQEHNLKYLGLVDLIITKQNKTNYLPPYMDLRWDEERHIKCYSTFEKQSLG
jgi:hypothetical protein